MTQSPAGGPSASTIRVSVVVPLFNEKENLEELAQSLASTLEGCGRGYEVLLVDDGSTDGSGELADRIVSHHPHFSCIHLRRNFGQTAAMAAGIDHAAGDVIVTLDADLQNDPRDIPLLLERLDQGFDVVSGWRKNRHDEMLTRRLPSSIANRLISWISGVALHDYGCTLKAYRREFLKEFRLYGEMHRFIPIYAAWAGARIVEVPVRHHPRRKGVSKYGLGRIPKVLLDLFVVKFLSSYMSRPIYFFGVFGFALFVLSFLSFALAMYLKWIGYATLIQTPLPLLAVFFAVVGILMLLVGLLAEVLMRTYYEAQGKTAYSIRKEPGRSLPARTPPVSADVLSAEKVRSTAGITPPRTPPIIADAPSAEKVRSTAGITPPRDDKQ